MLTIIFISNLFSFCVAIFLIENKIKLGWFDKRSINTDNLINGLVTIWAITTIGIVCWWVFDLLRKVIS